MQRRARTVLFGLAACAGWLDGGCADEREAVDRVQPGALDKAFFVGPDLADPGDDPEFYMRTTVVDVAAGAGSDGLFTNSDAQPTVRVRWELTEDLLLARLTYELIEDSDHKGARRTPDGQIVAAFGIEKHFDIVHEYNATTGEQINVVEENDFDRPWYEREYFRVDWSRNLITDAYDLDALSQLGIWYGVEWDPVAYDVTDPGNPDAPVFADEQGYFDVTLRALAAPQVIHDPEWGDYPACWEVGRWPMESCNPSEVTLRMSFLRVADHDYEPVEWDGTKMDMFGWFTWDRFGYDRRYGVVDDRWRRFATMWNLYERSHVEPAIGCSTEATTPAGADPHRDENGDGTEDECAAAGSGSRCDAVVGECTVPMRERRVKTIPWYVNPGYPEDLFEAGRRALDGWSDAIRVAVVAARLTECRRTGGTDCESRTGWPTPWSDDFVPPVGTATLGEVPRVFVLCHNPVVADDDAACGEPGLAPRIGDLRYNLLSLIDSPQQMSPWGIMMDAEDPLTGEKLAGSANQWLAVVDRAASQLADILDLLNGVIPPDEFLTGENVSDWVAENGPGGPRTRGAAMTAEEVASRRSAYDPAALAAYFDGPGRPERDRRVPPAVRRKARLDELIGSGRLGPGNAALSARLRTLRGSPIEAALVSPELAQAAGYDPTGPISEAAIERASPFGRMSPAYRRAQERDGRQARARRHSCRLEETEPDNLLGLAQVAERLFPAPDPGDAEAVGAHRRQVWQWAREQYVMGVFAHELGHSMGLRHNFAASFDSLNYAPQYWQLRTHDGEVVDDCPDGTTDGTDCVGPRWRDPLDDDELEQSIGRYATSSVMDYPGDANHDQLLQGSFDKAAVRFGYGGTVDVWDDPGVSVTGSGAGRAEAYLLTAFTTSPGLFGVYWFPPVRVEDPYEFIHYSRYQERFRLIRDCRPSDEEDAVLGTVCDRAPLDVVDYRDMRDFASDPDYGVFSWGVNARAVDAQGRVRRGYLFSSDEYADTGNVPSFTDDAGADAYEQIRFLEAQYENRYILDGFRRNRVMFNSWDTIARIQARYLDAIQLIAKTWAFAAILDGDPAAPAAELLEDGYYGPLAMGSTVALDLFARILTRPDPGYYCPADVCGTAQPVGVDDTVYVADWAALPDVYLYDYRVALGDGRYVNNDYDYSQGYFWSDYQTQVGAYYEKIWATYYLAEAFDYFISNSREDFTDGRYKNVNFATIYPEQVRRLYANLLTGDLDSYAPWVVVPSDPADTPLGTLRYPAWHDPLDLGTRPAAALLADPNHGWNERLYAMVWGAMYFPTNWSQSWIDDARITTLAADQVGWADAETYTFRDPASGKTYRAHKIGTEDVLGATHQKGVGARMLEWATRLLMLAYRVERGPLGNPEFNADGTPVLEAGPDGRPIPDDTHPGAIAALQRYVDDLDIFRQLTSTFERSMGDGDLPEP
ncbi:MAG: hypothetical protein HY905_15185 [Deltaproteobacteria bacterium]|nr:hypothetical protein [Deltaproteobacteria bacterium]